MQAGWLFGKVTAPLGYNDLGLPGLILWEAALDLLQHMMPGDQPDVPVTGLAGMHEGFQVFTGKLWVVWKKKCKEDIKH